jgi:DNA-binding Xre family transcriptional regulator
MTKLQKILLDKEMSQRDLQRAIFETFDITIGDAMISRIVNGRTVNLKIRTAKIIAETLEVTIEDIIEL